MVLTRPERLSSARVRTDIGADVRKDEPLEAMRGIAALIVIAWHLLLGFAPGLPGALPGFSPEVSWVGRPWFGLINGGGAVGFFFVLSGFVLTRRSLQTGNAGSLARGAIKRWPRLGGTVGIACLVSWALFPLGLYRFAEAGALSGSPWLSAFAYGAEGAAVVPNAWHALVEGTTSTFFVGSTSYNSSLWTMHIEFVGSFVAFGLGLALLQLPRAWPRLLLLLVAWIACFCVDPWLANFPLGVGIATLAASRSLPRLSTWWLPLFVLTAYAAATFSDNSQLNRFIFNHLRMALPGPTVYGLGAAVVLIAAESFPVVRTALSGRIARILGRMSFPLYLLHIPVLCSAGCFAYLAAGGHRAGAAAAAATTLVITPLVAWPLARFDVWWTGQVGHAVRKISAT